MFSFPPALPKFFADDNLQFQFEQQGFVVLPFYDISQIKQLEDFFYGLNNIPKTGFFPTTFLKELGVREKIDAFVIDTAQPSLSKHFHDIKTVHGSYIIKNPDKESELRLHQDMSLVDESKYSGVNIWCPLTDLTTKNGALYVLPGSHRIFPTYRGASIPNMYDKHTHFIKKYLKPLYLKAGEAVVFDQSIIHYSPPNFSNSVRITTNIFITQKNADYRMYYLDKNRPNEVEVFEQPDDFMTQFQQFGYDIFARPSMGRSIGFVPYQHHELDPKKMEALYGISPSTGFFQWLADKFKTWN